MKNQDALTSIIELSCLMQTLRSMGAINRLDPDQCDEVIKRAISLIYRLVGEKEE